MKEDLKPYTERINRGSADPGGKPVVRGERALLVDLVLEELARNPRTSRSSSQPILT